MAFTPYDWNQSIQNRDEYVTGRLREGSPVVALRYDDGVAIVSMRRGQRKVFEVYDRLMFAALGSQSDVEAVRTAAIDFAHQEGFRRSPDDVTIQRVAGFALSPALKRQFADPFRVPAIVRGVFAELGTAAGDDRFYLLEHDGEFEVCNHYACAAGELRAEARMAAYVRENRDGAPPLEDAIRLGLRAWAVGVADGGEDGQTDDADEGGSGEHAEEPPLPAQEEIDTVLAEQLKDLRPEVGVLERSTARESKFRLLAPDEVPLPT